MKDVTLRVESIGYGGSGVARLEGRVVFVPSTAPGDIVRARIVEERRNFLTAEVLEIIEPGESRRPPRCRHFGVCGGCSWQHVAYSDQLAAKEASVRESARRIGGVDPPVLPIIPSPSEWAYRTRARLKAGDGGMLGYFAGGSHRIVQVEECPILDPRLEELLPALRARFSGRTASSNGAHAELLLELDESGEVLSSLIDLPDGEEPGDLGFAQANREVNGLLRELVAREVSLLEEEPRLILDLYCGDGNLSLPLAQAGARVIGIDSSERSVRVARRRAAALGVTTADYRRGEIGSARAELLDLSRRADCLILDPPRRGLGELVGFIASFHIPAILYVSCAPPALARDLRAFAAAGYRIDRLQPLDMFPQSFHVETVATLSRPRDSPRGAEANRPRGA